MEQTGRTVERRRAMMGWCPYDGEECRHDGYCDDCEYNHGEEKK